MKGHLLRWTVDVASSWLDIKCVEALLESDFFVVGTDEPVLKGVEHCIRYHKSCARIPTVYQLATMDLSMLIVLPLGSVMRIRSCKIVVDGVYT